MISLFYQHCIERNKPIHQDLNGQVPSALSGRHLNSLARKTDDFERGVKRFLSKSGGERP
jgi:hypothetical protein